MLMSKNQNNKKTFIQYFKDFIPHFKTMKPTDIVIVCLEYILAIVMIVLWINFIYDKANNIPFLGEGLSSYEIVIIVFLTILICFVLFQATYDLIFKDYSRKNISEKVIKNGRVIDINSPTNKEDSNKDNGEKN